MERPPRERSPSFGREIDLLFLGLIEAHAPYEDYKREFLALEKRRLQRAKTPAQLRRLQQLGFRDLGMRVHVACLYVQALHLFPRQAREAWEMLEDTEQRALRLRRDSPLRQEHLESIAHAKKVARVPRPPPR